MLRLGQFIDEIKTQTEGELRVQYERAMANRQVLALRPSLLAPATPLAPVAQAAVADAAPALPPVLFTPLPAQPFTTATLPPTV